MRQHSHLLLIDSSIALLLWMVVFVTSVFTTLCSLVLLGVINFLKIAVVHTRILGTIVRVFPLLLMSDMPFMIHLCYWW